MAKLIFLLFVLGLAENLWILEIQKKKEGELSLDRGQVSSLLYQSNNKLSKFTGIGPNGTTGVNAR